MGCARTSVLQTPRLRLREMGMGDLDFVAGMLADHEVMRFYPKVYTRKEAQRWIELQMRRYVRDGHGLWLVELLESGDPVGQVGLLEQRVEGRWETEIGYLIHRPFWRQGFASEAALALREHSGRSLGRRRVIALIHPQNAPSQGVARKIGMAPEGETLFHGLPHVLWVVGHRS